MGRDPRPTARRRALTLTRTGLALAIALAGLVAVLVGDGPAADGIAMGLIGVAGLVVIANAFMRLGLSSQRDRRAEEDARRHFKRTGQWPS